jgi:hypothetical protein
MGDDPVVAVCKCGGVLLQMPADPSRANALFVLEPLPLPRQAV